MSDTPTPPDPASSTPRPKRPYTILGRLARAVREQSWFAVGLELAIVVLGVVIGFQVTAWGQARSDAAREQTYLRQLASDLTLTEQILAETDSTRSAVSAPAASRLVRSFGHDPKPPADSVLAWFLDAWTPHIVRPVLGTTNALVSSGDMNLIRDDSLRSAIITYLDLIEFLLDEQRNQARTAEEAGTLLSTRIDIPEGVAATLPDSVRERMSQEWAVGGIIPTGDWSSPIPLDVEVFYADPTMYTSAFTFALAIVNIARAQQQMHTSAAELRERVEAQIER